MIAVKEGAKTEKQAMDQIRRSYDYYVEAGTPNEYIEEANPDSRRRTKMRRNLTLAEKVDIVKRVKFEWKTYAEVAKEFRVTVSAVSAVMSKLRQNPKYLKELADHNYQRDKGRQLIGEAV